MLNKRNGTQLSPHFWLHEFQNMEGWAMVHPSVITSLEKVRHALCLRYRRDVGIRIIGSTRTKARNEALGAQLGWQDQGGPVSRDSKHLEQYGGIAVDISATAIGPDRMPVPQAVLAEYCRMYFDFVKADYRDGHVHADNRDRAKV